MKAENDSTQVAKTWYRYLQFTVYGLAVIVLLSYLSEAAWSHVLYVLCNIPILIGPWYVVHRYKIPTPYWLVPILTLFIFLAQILGSTAGFYDTYSWWDNVLHVSWGLISTVIGVVLFNYMLGRSHNGLLAHPGFLALFVFSFSLMTMTVWEIGEFSIDVWFGLDSQQGGWPDTMIDLAGGTAGALLVSVWTYHLIRTKKMLPFIPSGDR